MISRSEKPVVPPFHGWRMVFLACLCVNVGVGFSFGAYGTFMPSMIAEFSASRTFASAGLSLMVASMGMLAPVTSYAVRRWSIRATLAAGFVLMSAGWASMSLAANAWQYILAFGLLGGAAAACLIVVPPMTLINNWFIAKRGRATGFALVSVLLMIVPPLAAAGITANGWRITAMMMSLIALMTTPLTMLIIDRPESIGQRPLGAGTPEEGGLDATVAVSEQESPRRDPIFWVLMLCTGVYSGAGVAFGGHLVPFALGLGFNLKDAALLAGIFGADALGGCVLGGFLADRFGGARTFAALALLQAIAWPCLLFTHNYVVLAFCVAVIGLCANANLPVVTTLFANVFGRGRFARVMGLYSVLAAMPFNIALPLLAGGLYDLSGSYRLVFLIYAAVFAIVGTMFAFLYRIEVRRQAAASPFSSVLVAGA